MFLASSRAGMHAYVIVIALVFWRGSLFADLELACYIWNKECDALVLFGSHDVILTFGAEAGRLAPD